MNLADLYDYARNNLIEIIEFCIPNKKGMAVRTHGRAVIGIDSARLDLDYERKTVLAEELGHLENDGLMNVMDVNSPTYRAIASQTEYQAHAWSAKKLVPFEELLPLLQQQQPNSAIAEYFEVTPQLIEFTIQYYQCKNLLPIACEG